MQNKFSNLVNIMSESSTARHYDPTIANDGVDLMESASNLVCEFHRFNVVLSEAQTTRLDKTADLLTEAAEGGSIAAKYEALEEGFVSDLGQKLVAGFKRLIEMIKGILAKIAQFLDTMTKSGAQLVAKYKTKIAGVDRSKFEYEGFKWTIKDPEYSTLNPLAYMSSKGQIGEFKLEKIVSGTTFKKYPDQSPLEGMSDMNTDEAKRIRDSIKDELKQLETGSDMNEFKASYAAAVTGADISSYSKLSEALFKMHRDGKDAKSTIKGLSVSGFGFEDICRILEDGKDFSKVTKSYEEMKKSLETQIATIEKHTSDIERDRSKVAGDKKTPEGTVVVMDFELDFLRKTVSLANDLDAVAVTINNAALQAHKDRFAEAKTVFVKLMSYKPSKKQNNSAVDFLDEAFEEMDENSEEIMVECASLPILE